MIVPALFIGFTAIALVSALMVILHRNPVTSALFLVVVLCSLAGIYILMRAEFIGMVQVIVYAGAIMVLFLFVIMYLNLGHDQEGGATHLLRRMIGWLVGGLTLAGGVMLLAGRWAMGPESQVAPPPGGNTQALGQVLYTHFLYPFEITSLVLLVAMVGAIVVTKGHSRAPASPYTLPPDPTAGLGGMLRPGDTLTPAKPPGGEAA